MISVSKVRFPRRLACRREQGLGTVCDITLGGHIIKCGNETYRTP